MGNFKRGLFFGGLLGAGLVWLNATKKGKQTRDEMLDYAADVYDDVKARVQTSKKWKDMSKSKYYKMVEETVNKYAVENDLVDNMRDMVEKVVKAQWKNIKDGAAKK